MTALCGGGASQANPAYSNIVVFSSIALASYLNNRGMAWAYLVAPAIGTLTFNLPQFCATDPPPLPTFNSSDFATFFDKNNPLAPVSLVPKLVALCQFFLWADLCECVVGPQPPPPAPVADPTGWQPNPPALTTGPLPVNCGRLAAVNQIPNSNPYFILFTDTLAIPTGATSALITPFWTPSGIGATSTATLELKVLDQNADFPPLATVKQTMQTTGGIPMEVPLPLGANKVEAVITAITFPNVQRFSYEFTYWCNNQRSGVPVAPCCPPDITAQTILDSILQAVTLIQRQVAPFGYIASTVHSGITGAGELAVQGLLGVKVLPTTIPTPIGVEFGDPLEYFDMGWIAWGNADGFSARERITHAPFTSLPAAAGQYTKIGYTLAPGMVASFTELVREP